MTNVVMRDGVASGHGLSRKSTQRVPLRREAAAKYIRDTHGQPCEAKTLARLASVGGGPGYRRAGKYPLYEPDDLDRWARARLSPKIFRASDRPTEKRGSSPKPRGRPRKATSAKRLPVLQSCSQK